MRTTGTVLAFLFAALLLWSGCGTVEETAEATDTWTQPTPVPQTAQLEYRVDSLISENRRLRQQVDAMAAETRSLTARNAELETRLNEALTTPKAPPPPADMTAAYSNALAEYRRRNFSTAASQFTAMLKGGIREDMADNCHYWIGESYYGMGNYEGALEHLQMVFNYARSEKKDDAQMMIGNCHLAMRNSAAARSAFTNLVNNYPTSPYVARAQEKLATIK